MPNRLTKMASVRLCMAVAILSAARAVELIKRITLSHRPLPLTRITARRSRHPGWKLVTIEVTNTTSVEWNLGYLRVRFNRDARLARVAQIDEMLPAWDPGRGGFSLGSIRLDKRCKPGEHSKLELHVRNEAIAPYRRRSVGKDRFLVIAREHQLLELVFTNCKRQLRRNFLVWE